MTTVDVSHPKEMTTVDVSLPKEMTTVDVSLPREMTTVDVSLPREMASGLARDPEKDFEWTIKKDSKKYWVSLIDPLSRDLMTAFL